MTAERTLKYADHMISNYQSNLARSMDELDKRESDFSFPFFYVPLCDRGHILWAIDYLYLQGRDTTDLKGKLDAVDRQFKEFLKRRGEEYHDLVYKEFKALVRQYDPVEYYLDQYELDIHVEKRTDIEILFEELCDFFDLKDQYFDQAFEIRNLYADKVKGCDEVFLRELEKVFKSDGYCPDDLDIAPAHYWWLHLEGTYKPADDGEPEYEDKDPDELIENWEKLLDILADSDYRRELENNILVAKDAKRQGKKVRVYRR